MLKKFKPKLNALPGPQRRLWPELVNIPKDFVLYGGTAVSLRLGHRQSVDFDFFSSKPLDKDNLIKNCAFLKGAEIIQSEVDTLSVIINRSGRVELSLFGNITGRIAPPEITEDGTIAVASKIDLLAYKLKTILQRAAVKDYRDISALIQSGVKLSEGLAGAAALWPTFISSDSLKALTFFNDGDLNSLPQSDRDILITAAHQILISNIKPTELNRMNLIEDAEITRLLI